jgi:two-component system, cell cycle sensor histidine kinase and response regulator CckA
MPGKALLETDETRKSGVAVADSIGRVLVVDDEPELKTALVEALSNHGYEAFGFSSGHDALRELCAHEFDLLLTDLMMPEMDGITLLQQALKVDPNLIPIVMTGQGTIQTAVAAMKLGAFDYVLKPFRLQSLMPVLTRAVNTRRLRLENLQLRETIAIYELTQTIAFTLDPQTVLSKLTEAALQQTDADEVSVLLPTNDGREFYVAAARGDKRERLLGERIPFANSIASWVARERLPIILNGEVKDDRFVALWPRPDIQSSVSVPMQVANKLVGVLNVNVVNRSRPFALGQMKALSILAGTAAAALESAALYVQVRATEEKYRSIFENAVEGLFQSTTDGRLLTVNPAFATIFGYQSAQEMLNTVTDVAAQLYVHPEDRTRVSQLQAEQGIVEGFEFEARRKDGAGIWLSSNRRSVRSQSGEELYIEGSVEDITERKRTEERQRQSQQQYEALVQTIDGIVWEMDLDSFTFTFVSKQAKRLLGYAPEDWIGVPDFWVNHLHPEDRDWARDFCVNSAARNIDHQLDYRMIAADGRVVWLRDLVSVDHSNPQAPRLRGVMVDITERKQAEDELRQSERRYRDLIENARDIIYEHDLSGNYTAANHAAQQITGYAIAETVKLNLMQTVAPEYLEKAREMLRRKLAGETVTAYELEIVAKDGRHVAVEVNSWLVFQDGRPVGVQGIARNVAERKQLEEQLRQSQKLEAIGQLAGGVAHDFNNLLTVISGYSDLLLRRLPGDSAFRPSVAEIKKAGDRASTLTRQLLAFSRKQIMQPKVLDLNTVVADLDKMLRRLIGEDIDLLTLTEPGLGRVKADPGQIEQVVVNLVVNARDAMAAGGNLTIETANVQLAEDYAQQHVQCPPGEYVMLAVSDTGCGMDLETRERIFEPFFTTKEAGKGTGLGLSTVYGIVRQSGGNVWLYSEPNRGTSFKVYLPRVDEVTVDPEMKAGAGPAPNGNETLLLVEDETQVRQIAQQILEALGYKVLTAGNGEQALVLSRQYGDTIHLMVTDVVMPQMGGRELAERLAPERPDMGVLFMSGYTDDAIVRHGLMDELLEFIQKPFTADALARKVRKVLDLDARS